MPPEAGNPSWSPLDAFAPFLAGIDGGEALLAHANALARASDAAAFQWALSALFADLGYEPFVVDQSSRLGSQKVLCRLTTIARHSRFVVSLAELAYPQRYANTLDPVLRLHPEGLVFTYSPRFESSSVIFTQKGPEGRRRLVQRTIVGKMRGHDFRDNLVVWAWRLSGLRPRFGEEIRDLTLRASEHLGLPAVEIDRRWSTGAWAPAARPPGVSWEDSFEWFQQGFMEAAACGWFWGLERVLRNLFPLLGPEGGWRVRYQNFALLGDVEVASDALHAASTRYRKIRLELLVEDPLVPNAATESIELALPWADRRGIFLVDGVEARFAPRVTPTGTIHIEEPSRAAGATSDEDATSGWIAGTNLGTLLELSAARKLGAMAARLSRVPPDVPLRGHLRRSFSSRHGGRSLLCSRHVMRSALTPCRSDDSFPLPVLLDGPEGPIEPPAWCCPEITRALPAGLWYPVAGARVTPCGGLALPGERSGGTIAWSAREGSGLAINPRWGGPPAGPLEWWIAAPLREFARVSPGNLPRPLLLARYGLGQHRLVVAHRRGSALRAGIARRVIKPLSHPPQRLSCAAPLARGLPNLLVSPGARVEPGTPWLSFADTGDRRERRPVSVRLFRGLGGNARSSFTRWLRKHGLPRPDPFGRLPRSIQEDVLDAAYWSAAGVVARVSTRRVPAGIEGVVVDARIDTIYERGVESCWRATLIVRRPAEAALPALLWLADGTLVEDIDWLEPWEAPEPGDGPEVDVLVEMPEASDEPEGSMAACTIRTENVRILAGAPARVEGPDWHGRRRARDGEIIPGTPGAPGVRAEDRLWWALRDPQGHAEIARRECEWTQGAPPWWPSLQETLAAAGLTEPSNRVGEARSCQRTLTERGELRRGDAYAAPARTSWRCVCGTLSSATPSFDVCTSCQEPLRPLPLTGGPRLEAWLTVRLEILHPWARPAAAALLGMSAPEFDQWFEARPIVEAHAILRATLKDPLARVRERVAAEGKVDPGLLEPVAHLRALMATGAELPIFLDLSRLPRLPDALCPLWTAPGVPVPVQNRLSSAYLELERAVARTGEPGSGKTGASPRHAARRESRDWWWITAVEEWQRRSVQNAADRLFGSPTQGPHRREPGTLAELVTRILPWTRAPGLRSSPPGVVRISGFANAETSADHRRTRVVQRILLRPPSLADFRQDPAATATEESGTVADHLHPSTLLVPSFELASDGGALERTAVILDHGLRWQPRRPEVVGPWKEPRTWHRRGALAWFMDEGLRLLGALGLQDGVSGLSALSTLLAHVGPRSDLGPWMKLLTSVWGHRLPDDRTQALASVAKAVSEGFPGGGAAIRGAQAWLVDRLVGWWRVPASLDHPLGWRWLAGDAQPEGQCQRVIPGVRARAWSLLDGWLLLHSPCLWWLRDRSRMDLSFWPDSLRILAGVELWPLRRPGEAPEPRTSARRTRVATAPTGPARRRPSPIELPTAPREAPSPPDLPTPLTAGPEVTLFRGSLADWLVQQGRR